jgi:hypothetical protein
VPAYEEQHIGYPAQPAVPRNTIAAQPAKQENVSAQTDAQGLAVPPVTDAQMARVVAMAQAHLMKMLKDQAFDYTHPVDEYGPQGLAPATAYGNIVNIQSDYDMPEKIENILVVIPVGTTVASLQLGQRTLNLYSGAALTTPQIVTVPYCGIILNSDDPRTLTLTGVITSAAYLGLTGWALTRGQFS